MNLGINLFLLLTACSSKEQSASVRLADTSVDVLSSKEKFDIVPLALGSKCPLGGFSARAWTDKGGRADVFEDSVDLLLHEKDFCNTAENPFVELKSTVAVCEQDGQTDCYVNGTMRSADTQKITLWSIPEGRSFLGISGMANFASLTSVGAHRNQGTRAVSFAQLMSNPGALALWRTLTEGVASGYREVPRILSDDDGESGENNFVKPVIRSVNEWNTGVPRKVCGTAGTNLLEKIKDCAQQHVIKPVWNEGLEGKLTWNGTARGINSEGSWTLVTVFAEGRQDGSVCNSQCYEVWRDDRTGMVWSDVLKNGSDDVFNWCQATGSNFSSDAANPYRENDPVDICDSPANQNQTQSPKPVSLCFEDADWLETPPATFPMKGNMHKRLGASTKVKWRLPTRADWLMAEHNGYRHVFPNAASNFWTATVSAYFEVPQRSAAYTAGGTDGDFLGTFRYSGNKVRCIGTPDMAQITLIQPASQVTGSFLDSAAPQTYSMEKLIEPAGSRCPHGGLRLTLTQNASAAASASYSKTLKTNFLCKKSPSENIVLDFVPAACTADGQNNCLATSNFKAYNPAGIEPLNFVAGRQFAGLHGTANAGFFVSSGISRTALSQAMSYSDEIYKIGVNTLLRNINTGTGAGSREIPRIVTDDEGFSSATAGETYGGTFVSSAARVIRTRTLVSGTYSVREWNAGVPRRVCGKSATTLVGKIADCENRHAVKPDWDAGISGRISWNGTQRGVNSEGRWTLVTVFDATLNDGDQCSQPTGTVAGCYEVWRDDRTGMLWSDRLQDSASGMEFNWCEATGNHTGSNPANPYKDDDPFGICSNPANQNQATPFSMCHEDADWLSTPSAVDMMKGNMHMRAGASLKVKWRIPTRRDWELAEFNGMRLVLPLSFGGYFWLSTVDSTERSVAATFSGIDGSTGVAQRSTQTRVRCIGIPDTLSAGGGP